VAAADCTIYRTILGIKNILQLSSFVLPNVHYHKNRRLPTPKDHHQQFYRDKKVNNKSNHKFWRCNHCPEDSWTGQHIEDRDNHCLLHLTNPKDCPNAPQTVHHKAQQALIQKGIQQEVPLFGDANAVSSTSDARTPDDVDASITNSALVVVKKQKLGDNTSLDGLVDHALTPLQQQNADVKLFGNSTTIFHFGSCI
jgi:hypothetical protein